MTNEEDNKEELREWLKSLLLINESRLDEVKFIKKQLSHKEDEIIHLRKQIKLTNDLIDSAYKELNK